MRFLLFTMIVCSLSFGKTALQFAREVEDSLDKETVEFRIVKKWTDQAMNRLIYVAVQELRSKGQYQFANDFEAKWENVYKSSMFTSQRDIGDHAPVSQWLSEKYEFIEIFLGKDTCRLLHISDIKSLNHGIPVTIKPGTFPMDSVQGERIDEYRRHFAGGPSGGDYYYGTIPVCAYWAAMIGCQAAGGSFACGLIASLTERLIDIVAANLSDRIYNRFNGGN